MGKEENENDYESEFKRIETGT